MSRRKQARPRHVDDPDLESPAITAISVVPVFTDEDSISTTEVEGCEKIDTPPDNNKETVDKLPAHIPGYLTDQQTLDSETKTCKNCQREFLSVGEWFLHKNECLKPPIMLMFEDTQEQAEIKSDVRNGTVFDSETPVKVERKTVEHYPSVNDSGQTDNNNIDSDNAETDVEEDQNNFDDHSNIDDLDDYNSSLEDDDAEFDNLKQNDMNKKRKQGPTAAELAAYMQQLSSLIPTMTAAANSSSNVMLEPLEATKAAVAQFAENNPDQEREVSKLHAALFNLQQQQIMQLQLIQQLQQQLIANGTHVGQLHSMSHCGFANIGLPGFNMPRLSGSLNNPDVVKTSPRHESPLPKSECPSPTENGRKTSCSSTPEHSDQPSTPPSSGKACTSELTSAPSLNKNCGVSVTSSSPSTLLLDFTQSSFKGSSKSQSFHGTEGPSFHGTEGPSFHSAEGHLYHGTDDPFFKHKCRLCGKVFGSDSALQIHVRSHTDFPPLHDAFLVDGVPFALGAALSTDYWTWEKPFQCNICGGRFSTRGNLKVHFQRHKSEFPNVEMNPNPVPEHLDKTPMPMLGSPFQASALTPFSNPAFMAMPGFMNGFLFPPPHLAPRQPMAAHAMLPQQNLNRENREKRASSPKQDSQPSSESRKDQSFLKSETPNTPSDAKDDAKILNLASTTSFSISRPSHMIPVSSIPLVSTYPVMSSLSTQSHFQPHYSSSMSQSSLPSGDPFRNTILPSNILDNDDNLEQFMEIDKSETSKLQQLVDNIEHKLTDPNQCVICQRVLSCKSALQMHYRIHTGERPFKCKICGRSFTTKGNLKTHMGVHRAKPPLRMMHQCPVCHKQFTNLLVLQQHIRSHTGMSALPGIPGMSHMGLFAPHPSMQEHYQHSPLNMKHHYPESYEKELDLSKKPRLDGPNLDNCNNSNHINGERENVESNDVDSDNEDHNEMDDEANKLAADDAKKEGLGRENNHFKSTPESVNDATETRADLDRQLSNRSDDIGFTSSLARAPSPKYLQEDSNHGQENNYNAYSTSLAALEERVRQIDTTMACNPLSQFHAAPFLLAPSYLNGDRSVSPKSESGSDEGRKPSTPGSSNGSISGNYMLGALDGRPLDGNSKATTCNVCYKTFACKSALDIHYRSHTHERPYKCDLCDKTFTTRGNMKQHLLTHKLNGEMSDNDDCENNNNSCTPNQNENDSDNDTSQSTQLESQQTSIHNESQHSAKKKDIVSPPEKSGSTTHSPAASLDRHNASYTSPDSYQSPFISKTPTVKHQCLVCQKGFSSASALQIHIRTHTGDKPFKCTVCGKAFTTKGNLKVHMGTHMWNNSPSRRGRRMSIEPPFMLAHKENPYLPHGFSPRPDFYPFQFPPFMNGLPSLKSLSEVSMMAGSNCRMGIKQELSSPPSANRRKSETSPVLEEKPKYAESGELDLSMKSTGSSGSRSSEKTSPSSIDSNSSGMVSPPHMSLGWGWKASCHLCSRSFPTPVALEHHIRSMHMMNESLSKGGAS